MSAKQKTTKSKASKTKATKGQSLGKAIAAARKAVGENLAAIEATEAGKTEGKQRAKVKGTKGEKKSKQLSAIDAAAQVLAKAGAALSTKELIEAMAQQGLWTSPGGKTPHATLYSAILREINEKGKDARFVKTERGRFAANG